MLFPARIETNRYPVNEISRETGGLDTPSAKNASGYSTTGIAGNQKTETVMQSPFLFSHVILSISSFDRLRMRSV